MPLLPSATPVLNRQMRLFWITAAALTFAFALPLFRLVLHAARTDIQSHILLVPFVSWYLMRVARQDDRSASIQSAPFRPSPLAAGASALLASIVLAGFCFYRRSPAFDANDALSLSTLSYLLFLLAVVLATLGWPALKARLFPAFFLIFLIPIPTAVLDTVSAGLQHASADVSDVIFRLIGMPVLRDGLSFKLPRLTIFVANECSGIRSTLVLFMTSLVAGYLLLRNPIHRAILAFIVFPLGVARNAFRITTISWLTVNVDSGIIDSPLHHRGGPLFFAISLIPMLLLVYWFRLRDRRAPATA